VDIGGRIGGHADCTGTLTQCGKTTRKVEIGVCVCVCVRERERERERHSIFYLHSVVRSIIHDKERLLLQVFDDIVPKMAYEPLLVHSLMIVLNYRARTSYSK